MSCPRCHGTGRDGITRCVACQPPNESLQRVTDRLNEALRLNNTLRNDNAALRRRVRLLNEELRAMQDRSAGTTRRRLSARASPVDEDDPDALPF